MGPREEIASLKARIYVIEEHINKSNFSAGLDRKTFIRNQAVSAIELMKGHLPEQRENYSNAEKTVEEFADYILELTN